MKRSLVFLFIAAQALFLIGLSVSYYMIDIFGETIKLETVPIDPQDVFYGDYLILDYEAEEIDGELWVGSEERIDYGEVVYVVLEKKDNGYHEVVKASDQKLTTEAHQSLLKATYDYHDDFSGEDKHRINLGFNRYYIEDNTGGKFEASGELDVTVAVAPWGQKKIVEVE
ncbi:GDYXXLXY domain-containing protein [Saliterribacillus persicus]|uniref:Putative membrane-anchored protein n=1 Tax=Saliterribacillus persicus TaxID=930114 RepID=A0A368XRC7_9BACI|nr:GDYXXLXY domain-containing protein [Saliterribacillus persicus]RCW69706.1 putative membrane-anchored protein [Saliterribacillus persicus]